MNTTTLSSSTHVAQAPTPLAQDAKIMGLVGLAHASSHFGHLLLPPMFPILMKEFGFNFAQAGLLMTVIFVISGIGQALSGFAVDKFGARPIMFASLTSFIAACVVMAYAQNYSWLIAAAILSGVGNCPFHPVDFSILNQRVSSPRLGYAFSVHGLSGSLGWALTPVFLVGLMNLMGSWRSAYVAAAAFYAAILLLLVWQRQWISTPTAAQTQRNAGAIAQTQTFAFLKLPVVWWCFSFFLVSTITMAVMQNYSVPIIKAMHGVSLETATMVLTAYMIFNGLGVFAGGFVATRYGAQSSDKTVAICMTMGAALMMLAGTGWTGATGSIALLAATGFAVGIGLPSRDLMIKRATPKGATGRIYGTVYSGLDVGFAVAPMLFALLMDRGLYAMTMIVGALGLLFGMLLALGVGRQSAQT